MALLFEGRPAAVDAQVAAAPGEVADGEVWKESARLQQEATLRAPYGWQDCLLARPGPGHAYLADGAPHPWSPLAQRVRASFDPDGILC